jgi:acetyltransferase-like isoleucine patch superfamily enzyme
MSTFDRLVARLLGRGAGDSLREVVAEQDPRQAGPQAHVDMYKYLVHGDRARLHIHPTAVVNNALFNVGSGDITVGEYAFFGHNVSVLTGTHDINTFGRERQFAIPRSGRDIVIEEGVWLASNVMVLGPCRIGAHAVVGGGSLVLGDVEPYTIVAGSPARFLRTIPHD